EFVVGPGDLLGPPDPCRLRRHRNVLLPSRAPRTFRAVATLPPLGATPVPAPGHAICRRIGGSMNGCVRNRSVTGGPGPVRRLDSQHSFPAPKGVTGSVTGGRWEG